MELTSTRAWGPERLRPLFPAFDDAEFARVSYLDSAATSQRLRSAIAAQASSESAAVGNPHRGAHRLASRSSDSLEASRAQVAAFLGVPPAAVAFVSGATEAANLLARAAQASLRPSDIVYATEIEHHSNYLPWMAAAKAAGAVFKAIPAGAGGELDLDWFEERVALDRPKWLAVSALSNVTGNAPPLAWMAELARRANPEALVVADASQAGAHLAAGAPLWGADFAFISSHKVHAPAGSGVLAALDPALFDRLEPGKYGGGMIRGFRSPVDPRWAGGRARFEAGSSNPGGAAGLASALSTLSSWDLDLLRAHEAGLASWLAEELARIDGVRVLGGARRHGMVSFDASWAHAHDVGAALEEAGALVRVGHHCALPLMRAVGSAACARASFCCFSTEADAEAVVEGVQLAKRRFG